MLEKEISLLEMSTSNTISKIENLLLEKRNLQVEMIKTIMGIFFLFFFFLLLFMVSFSGFLFFIEELNAPLNKIASRISGRKVFGKAYILPYGYKSQFLSNLFREEFLSKYKAPLSR